MNKSIIMAFGLMFALVSCQQHPQSKSDTSSTTEEISKMNLTDCDINFDGVKFTKSLNGGDSLVHVQDSILTFSCSEGRDIFNDPNGKLSNHTIPAILAEVDNSKPFTLSVKVRPGFTREGTYNAADLLVFANDTLYQKLCFEQDERGNHRVVSVRTVGTSDDNNHDVISGDSVYLKLSSDTETIASYYSVDGKEWYMVRLYRNEYPANLLLGIASQAPVKGECTSVFTDLTFSQDNVTDFRMGE